MNAPSLLLLVALAASDTYEDHTPPPRTLGLLTPPQMSEGPPGCSQPSTDRPLTVRESAVVDASSMGELRFVAAGDCSPALPRFHAKDDAGDIALPLLESGYEKAALSVLEQHGRSFRIALSPGRCGWIEAPADYRYQSLSELLADSLDYLVGDGRVELCREPGVQCAPFHDDEATVRVLETRESGETTWFRIDITTSFCADAGSPRPLASGWVRSHRTDGRLNLWFRSRGC
jgi:hypothetical protein